MTKEFNPKEARKLVERLTGFTSKRWHLVPDELGEPAMCIKSDGFDICTAWGGYNRADADAALIAAAPDLLAALTAALDEIERLREYYDAVEAVGEPTYSHHQIERVNTAREALKGADHD